MNNKYVVAVSGGVDSVYLVHYLARKNQVCAIVHINHHTRGLENEREQALVNAIGEEYNLPVYVFDYYHANGNFQSSARKYRYQMLGEVAKKYYNKVATAHHLDDQLENCLLPKHLVKSNLIEYRIQYDDFYIYRPLLGISKTEIYNRVQAMNVVYFEDGSNQNTAYQRNQYRLNLRSEDLKLQTKIDYILEYNKQVMTYGMSEFTEIDREILKTKTSYFRYLKLYKLIKNYDSNINVQNRKLLELDKLVKVQKNSKFSVANSTELSIGYDKIYMLVDSEDYLSSGTLKKGKNEFNGIEFIFDSNEGQIRVWQPGDKVQISSGHKKVARLFIDNKIESHMRKRWPIVINKKGEIIYIPKLWRKNEINK